MVELKKLNCAFNLNDDDGLSLVFLTQNEEDLKTLRDLMIEAAATKPHPHMIFTGNFQILYDSKRYEVIDANEKSIDAYTVKLEVEKPIIEQPKQGRFISWLNKLRNK